MDTLCPSTTNKKGMPSLAYAIEIFKPNVHVRNGNPCQLYRRGIDAFGKYIQAVITSFQFDQLDQL